MRELDGMRIMGPEDGEFGESARSTWRELVSASETSQRWRLGEVTARPDPGVATHIHPGEPEALIILDGEVELHGAEGILRVGPGEIVYVPQTPSTDCARPKAAGGWRSGRSRTVPLAGDTGGDPTIQEARSMALTASRHR